MYQKMLPPGGGSSGASSADKVTFNNEGTGLVSDNVQSAIEEVNDATKTNSSDISGLLQSIRIRQIKEVGFTTSKALNMGDFEVVSRSIAGFSFKKTPYVFQKQTFICTASVQGIDMVNKTMSVNIVNCFPINQARTDCSCVYILVEPE